MENSSHKVVKRSKDPGLSSVQDYIVYGLSVPERMLRSTAAMFGGAVQESASLLVPQAFRDSKSYQTFVQQMLDIVVNDVGGVEKEVENSEDQEVENYVARKTVGSFVDLAGMATLHVSPVLVLAIVSDIAYGSKTYLNELSDELKSEGVIAAESTISSAADLLESIGEISNETATAFDTPPISYEGLKNTIDETTDNLAKIDPTKIMPKSEIDRFFKDLNSIADQQEVGMIQMSSALSMYTLNQLETVSKGALTSITVTGGLLDKHVLRHYWDGLEQISERGIYVIVAESSKPYVEAVWANFESGKSTVTEDIVTGRFVGKIWDGVRDWFGSDEPNGNNESPNNED